MNGIRLTTRGKIVLAIIATVALLGLNWITSDKSLACDWRHGVTKCKIITFEEGKR
jgi:hypothetical protein